MSMEIGKTTAYVETPKVEVSMSTPAQTVVVESIATNTGLKGDNREQEATVRANPKNVQSAVNNANSKMKNSNTRCEFAYHEGTKRVSIKVIDKDTEEVIKEFPPEETLKMIEKIWELNGVVVDEKR